MTAQEELKKMITGVNSANVVTVEGRGIIASNCNKLYNLIEKKVINTEKCWMLEGAYKDLFEGNFSTPFHCEQKRHTFKVCAEIYKDL